MVIADDATHLWIRYLQFVFNASIVGVCLYLVLMFLWTIRNDVKERMATYSSGSYSFIVSLGMPLIRILAFVAQRFCRKFRHVPTYIS